MIIFFVNRYIDRGCNPQLYTKDCIEKALHKNEQVKGKIDILKKFKANVLSDLGQTFPNELAKYRALRSNNYSSSSVSAPTATSLGGPSPQVQQQNVLGGSTMSIQQQLNNAISVTNNNFQLQSSTINISSLGSDSSSTVFSGSNNNIDGPSGSQ